MEFQVVPSSAAEWWLYLRMFNWNYRNVLGHYLRHLGPFYWQYPKQSWTRAPSLEHKMQPSLAAFLLARLWIFGRCPCSPNTGFAMVKHKLNKFPPDNLVNLINFNYLCTLLSCLSLSSQMNAMRIIKAFCYDRFFWGSHISCRWLKAWFQSKNEIFSREQY